MSTNLFRHGTELDCQPCCKGLVIALALNCHIGWSSNLSTPVWKLLSRLAQILKSRDDYINADSRARAVVQSMCFIFWPNCLFLIVGCPKSFPRKIFSSLSFLCIGFFRISFWNALFWRRILSFFFQQPNQNKTPNFILFYLFWKV